jgi:hypothetical protein
MKICKNCMKASENLLNSFTRLERIHMFSAAVSLARHIDNGPEQDKMVSSSVITKLLLSFNDPATRDGLLKMARKHMNSDIVIRDCPHSIVVLEQ